LQVKHTTHPGRKATIQETFDLQGATPFGGANLLLDYSRHIGLDRKIMAETVPFEKRSNAVFPLHQVVEYLVLGRVLGLSRISTFGLTEADPLLCCKWGVDGLPDPTLLYYDLRRFDSEEKRQVLRNVSLWAAQRRLGDGIILDIDTSVETVYGHLEGAAVGYNPEKRGRPSFQPIFAFDGVSRALLRAELRPGNMTAGSDPEFLARVLADVPEGVRVIGVRIDRGFQGEATYTILEGRDIPYANKLKMTRALKDYADQHVVFRPIGEVDGDILEVGAGWYQAGTWTKARRVIFVRKRSQDGLFAYAYDYQAIVTTYDWDPEDVFHFYNHRCTQETMIREGKEGFGIDVFSSMDFAANYADLLIKGIAYNVSLAFQKDLLPQERHWTIQTLRRLVFVIPAVLSRHARTLTLHLAAQFAAQSPLLAMRKRLVALRC